MTQLEHLHWAQERTLVYLELGDADTALRSFMLDLEKDETFRDHPGFIVGFYFLAQGELQDAERMRRFIMASFWLDPKGEVNAYQ